MKQFITAIFLSVGLCQTSIGGPSPLYENIGYNTNMPVVDAVSFVNYNLFYVETGSLPPYMTKDTLSYTNFGTMLALDGGFRFDTGTSTGRHNAKNFLNTGTVEAWDLEGAPYLTTIIPASPTSTFTPVPLLSQPIPSQILVLATNIVNTGIMSVGDCGLLHLEGNNVTNNGHAALIAGSINTAGTAFDPVDPEDTTGLEGEGGAFGNTTEWYTGSPGVYDLFWGTTNGNINAEALSSGPPSFPLPMPPVSFRDGAAGIPPAFALNPNPPYSVSVYFQQLDTNYYYNIVCVNTNFAGANITAAVGFAPTPLQVAPKTAYITNAIGAIVQFTEPVFDIASGQWATNGVYLLDDGAYLSTMVNVDNASSAQGYSRPNAFALTTETPGEWTAALPGNTPYSPAIFYQAGEYVSNTPPLVMSVYGAQIGRNPAVLSGYFDAAAPVALPDPTNDPGRIEITAANLDITGGLMRAEGMVVLNVTNLVGAGTAGMDLGEINATIGVTNTNTLVVSNLFPSTFQRLRGNIYAWSGTWEDTQTNNANGNTNAPAVGNNFYYHILVVEQVLVDHVTPVERNLSLTGKASISVLDPLTVINQGTFNTTNLYIDSSVVFSQNAASFTPANAPYLKNLFVDTNGILEADDLLDVGYNMNQGQTAPAGRKYSVNSITNFGAMAASAALLQSASFENDGIISGGLGSVVIEANSLGMGLAVPTLNAIESIGGVTLSATTIQAVDSMIFAGLAGQGTILEGQGSLTLDATAQLTDFVPGVPTTNTNSVIVNYWTVTGGFSLPVKPATGDLFGTEIQSIVTSAEQAVHVWAGADRGPNAAGFTNNVVIGHLLLDRQSSNSLLRFSAAGSSNAMYVDYLELTNFAISDYRHGLVIDPNFHIYFADCNADPEKLMEVYPNLVWVPSFVGPNSVQIVPYFNSSNVCLMNAALADSTSIAFFPPVPNSQNQPYVLNNPTNPADFLPCPGEETTLRSFLVATHSSTSAVTNTTYNLFNVAVNGKGSITPGLKETQMALGKNYTLTAVPASGWVFKDWSTIGLAVPVNTNSRVLTFKFVTNTLLAGNFIPNPFGGLHGAYNGLFFQTNATTPDSSGAFTLTLLPNGTFSGRLLMGPATYHFSSQFTGDGVAQFQALDGTQSLAVNLQLDMGGGTGRIIGDVNGGTWDALLFADIAPTWTAQHPSPLANRKITMVLPWGINADVGGDGYGVGTVSRQGVLAVAGTLADGTTFSASAPVSQYNQWPFYAYAPQGKDTIFGWVSLVDGVSGTNVIWYKAPAKGLYGAGLSNVIQLTGSLWQAPPPNTPALSLANPTVILSGGDLLVSLTNAVSLESDLVYAATNLTLSIKASSGSFSGWFENPATGGRETISGVVLQNANGAQGLFLGSDQSGAVLLESQ